MAATRKDSGSEKPRRPPATTPQSRENQMISLAVDLAEKQITKGTASAQVITHYLKLGTAKESLERKKLEAENALLKARVENIASAAQSSEMYTQALNAMRAYSGQEVEIED